MRLLHLESGLSGKEFDSDLRPSSSSTVEGAAAAMPRRERETEEPTKGGIGF